MILKRLVKCFVVLVFNCRAVRGKEVMMWQAGKGEAYGRSDFAIEQSLAPNASPLPYAAERGAKSRNGNIRLHVDLAKLKQLLRVS